MRNKRLIRKIKFLFIPAMVLLPVIFLHFILRMSNPYLLKVDKYLAEYPEIIPSDYGETYEVYRGNITETLFIETTLPGDAYKMKTMTVADSNTDEITEEKTGAGDLAAPSQTILVLNEKEKIHLPVLSRIISVEDTEKGLEISYLPSQRISFRCYADISYLNRISFSSPVSISFPGISDEPIKGKITNVGDFIEKERFPIVFSYDDENITGRSGATVQAAVTIDEKTNVLLIPSDCILTDPSGSSYVFIHSEEGPSRVPVVTGITDGNRTEILKGLKEGNYVYRTQ